MMYAFLFTININNDDSFVSAITYERLKEDISKYRKTQKPWNMGKHGIYSDEYRKRISESHADVSGKNNPMYGRISPRRCKKANEETCRKISEALKGKKKTITENVLKQRAQQKLHPPTLGKKMVFNPITLERKYVNKEDLDFELQNGFVIGFGPSFQKGKSKNLSDAERQRLHDFKTALNKDSKWLINRSTGNRRFVKGEKITELLNQGYEFGFR